MTMQFNVRIIVVVTLIMDIVEISLTESLKNSSLDACEDFYEFVCSSYETEKDALKIVETEMNEQIARLLQEPKRPNEANSVHKAKDMHLACMNDKDRKKVGNAELRRIIENDYGGWPILNRTNDNGSSWEIIAGKLRRLGYSLLVKINVNIDQRNGSRHIIELDRSRAEYVPQLPTNILTYMSYVAGQSNFIHDTAVLLGAESGELIKSDIEDMLRFQMKLNRVINEEINEVKPTVHYNAMKISDLNRLTSDNIDWSEFLKSTFESVKLIGVDEEIIVLDSEYLKHLGDLIKITDKKILKNYLLWRLVKDIAEDGDPDMVASNPERNNKNNSKLEICLKEVKGFLGFAVTNLYVNNIDQKYVIDLVRSVVNAVMSAFRNLIRTNHWMDKPTKDIALIKLQNMVPKIGFPKWIMDAKKLDNYYEKAEVSENHFANIMNLSYFYSLQELQLLNTIPNRSSWVTSPLMANAFYHRTMNDIYIPVAIIQKPFLDAEWPMAAIFGGIGAVIGHEITHGFDDKSLNVAANRSLVNWWTSETTPRYEKLTKCIINQYDQYCPTNKLNRNQQNICVDGRKTLNENVADIGGLKAAFMAYQFWKLQNGNISIPYESDGFTDDQLFFTSFARIWCSSMTPNIFLKQFKNSINSPNKYRLLGSIKNLDNFNVTFNCELSRPSNDHCNVW